MVSQSAQPAMWSATRTNSPRGRSPVTNRDSSVGSGQRVSGMGLILCLLNVGALQPVTLSRIPYFPVTSASTKTAPIANSAVRLQPLPNWAASPGCSNFSVSAEKLKCAFLFPPIPLARSFRLQRFCRRLPAGRWRRLLLGQPVTGEANMAKYWFGTALLAGCLATATVARAQCSDPPPMVPGPLSSQMAPPGPATDLSLHTIFPMPSKAARHLAAACREIAWFSVEWLYWWTGNPRIPFPLVTTGDAGIVGNPGTVVLLGPGNVDFHPGNGARLTAGLWFNSDRTFGGEASGFGLENRSETFSVNGPSGIGTIFIPFFDPTTGQEAAQRVTSPAAGGVAAFAGGVIVSNQTRLWGANSDLLMNVSPFPRLPLILLAGFRYLALEDTFDIAASTFTTANNITFQWHDHSSTHNIFYGGELGARTQFDYGPFTFTAQAKVAAGDTHESRVLTGTNTTFQAGQPTTTAPFALFVVRSNGGHTTADRFGVIPEGTAKIGYHLGDQWILTAGYDVLWWNRVLRRQSVESQHPYECAVRWRWDAAPAAASAGRTLLLGPRIQCRSGNQVLTVTAEPFHRIHREQASAAKAPAARSWES